MQDIKINSRRITNITKKDISVSYIPKSVDRVETIEEEPKEKREFIRPTNTIKSYPHIKEDGSRKAKWFLPTLTIILFLVIVYWGSVFFERTKVEIENKKQTFTLEDKQMNASKDVNANIPFEIMIVPDEELKNITLTDGQEASTKSKGEITFYNEYSSTPQKLLANTYIKDEAGKLYTLDSEVTIPGYTQDKDKKIIGGTATVTASSFLLGESYNGNPSDFTVNSFKGTTKLNKIYAKAKTSFTGGALGLVYVLNANDKGILNSYAATSFKNNLYRKVNAQIPEGYILYPNAISFAYNINGDSFFKDKNAEVPIDGTLSAIIMKKSDLSKALIKNLLPKISEQEFKEIQVLNPDSLKFNFIVKDQPITKELTSFDFTFNGDLNMLWNINTELIQSKLVGISKESVEGFLKQDPGIKNAVVRIFPPWSSTLPKEVSKIKVLIK